MSVSADGTPDDALVVASGLTKHFDLSPSWLARRLGRGGRVIVRAVDDVSFAVRAGRTLSLVGESGCGKSTVARLLVGLYRPTAGEVRIDGRQLADALASPEGRVVRRRTQMVFQDPYASLNPRWRVQDIVAEPLVEHGLVAGRRAARARVVELLEAVGLRAEDAQRFPHQFSGGQRQRISIARAIATEPAFLVCDEPTSALDVSVQAQVLNLLRDLQQARGLAYLFISHNIALVRHMSDDVGVMYLGRLVELADRERLFARPRHPYTRLLLAAVPDPRRPVRDRVVPVGELPDPIAPPAGCAFHPRCPHANERCRVERPALLPADGVRVACHAVAEGRL